MQEDIFLLKSERRKQDTFLPTHCQSNEWGILRKLMKKEKMISYILLFVALIDLIIMSLEYAYVQSFTEAFVLTFGPIGLLIASGKLHLEEKRNVKGE